MIKKTSASALALCSTRVISNALAPPSQAIVFKNYMGSGYKTKNWKSFVNNVRDGDFIGIDFKSDGSVDHIGFVHTKSGGRLRIAQHTINYLKWNGDWPKHDSKGTYYRVRR